MVKSIHSKAFSDLWQALHHATNPRLAKDRWQVDGVDWIRETQSIWGRDYSFRLETHVLRHGNNGPSAWVLLVVVERWWGRDRARAVKTAEWRQVIKGKQKQILSWFAKQKLWIERQRPTER